MLPDTPHRPQQKFHRGHEIHFAARRDGRERASDESHVVIEGQPVTDDVAIGHRKRPTDHLGVRDQVSLGDDDALG